MSNMQKAVALFCLCTGYACQQYCIIKHNIRPRSLKRVSYFKIKTTESNFYRMTELIILMQVKTLEVGRKFSSKRSKIIHTLFKIWKITHVQILLGSKYRANVQLHLIVFAFKINCNIQYIGHKYRDKSMLTQLKHNAFSLHKHHIHLCSPDTNEWSK